MAKIPETIGKYKVISEVGRGGMGAVYTAGHPTLDRTVIIKKLTIKGDADIRERFRREASIMMDFRNEYIVDVFDHFREGAAYYIVQEYVDGMSLADLLKRERYLPERVALLVFRDCCRALKYAHDRGVIHRDIKPGNILLSKAGDVKLVDFGVAHVEEEEESTLTHEGALLGTPSYMAPEQFEDTRTVDKRADIYSLGVMLYEMTTGERPFPGSFTPEALRKIQRGKYRRPRKLNPALSRLTARIIRKAMSAKRSRRYQDVGTILERLDRHFGARPVGEERPEIASFLAGTWMPAKRRSRLEAAALAGAGVVLLLAAGTAYYGFSSGRANLLLQPDRYGALRVTVRVTGPPASGERPLVSAGLFRDDGGKPSPVRAGRVAFHVDERQTTAETTVFESRRLFLPAGLYRLDVASEGQLVWKGFYLDSENGRRSEGRAVAQDLTVDIGRQVNLPVEVSLAVASTVDRAVITAGTAVALERNGSWVPFSGPVAANLTSGHSYRFRFEHDGYYPAEYVAAVAPFQSYLRVEASLVPYPGALDLSAAMKGVRVTLDGSSVYRRWGRAPQPAPLPAIGNRPSLLLLAPGSYTLAAQVGPLRGAERVRVQSLTRQSLHIVADSKTKTLRFEDRGSAAAPQLAGGKP